MPDSLDPTPSLQTQSPRARVVAVALVVGVLSAGCGGASASQTVARTSGASTSGASTSDASTSGASTSGASTSGASTTRSAVASAGPPSALAFADCMRANGVTNFPDPNPGGGFTFHASAAVTSSPAFRGAQARCQKFMPGGGPLSPGPPPSAQTMTELRRIADCMREHGVPTFPDPKTAPAPQRSVNLSEYRMITNYKGAILLFPATIDMQSPAYEQAATDCGAGFLGGQGPH